MDGRNAEFCPSHNSYFYLFFSVRTGRDFVVRVLGLGFATFRLWFIGDDFIWFISLGFG